MASSVPSVYIHVIEDVISKVREEFVNSGAGESILGELQALWETKMMQCGVISPNTERPSLQKNISPITPMHDLNAPPVEEYETPTAEMFFPPTPMQTPVPQTPLPQTPLPQTPFPQTQIQTPLPGAEQMYNAPSGLYGHASFSDVGNGGDMNAGRPSLYMPSPSPWMNQKPLGVDVNVAYVEGRDEVDRAASNHLATQDFFMMPPGKRKRNDYASHIVSGGYMPQQDGAGDMTIEFVLPKENELSSTALRCSTTTHVQSVKGTMAATILPQQDGVQNEYDHFRFQEVTNEDYNTTTPPEHGDSREIFPFVGTPKPNNSEVAEDDEPPLNEDDDEDDLDDFDQEEEPNTQHLILAQFDKVTRTKSRWKCNLKDGIMHINNKDFLFNKANGEFEF